MSNDDDYQSLLNLLPFYVNGTLGPADCARIDAMLETSAELRAELEIQHQIARKTIQEGRAIMATTSDPQVQLQAILPQLGIQAPHNPQQGSIIIQLHSDAIWAMITALLSKEELSIMGGPNDGALLLSSHRKGAALDALIIRLKASPVIMSADKIT
jgi:hypothetical protein